MIDMIKKKNLRKNSDLEASQLEQRYFLIRINKLD